MSHTGTEAAKRMTTRPRREHPGHLTPDELVEALCDTRLVALDWDELDALARLMLAADVLARAVQRFLRLPVSAGLTDERAWKRACDAARSALAEAGVEMPAGAPAGVQE